jgi:hypothetical protein
VARSVARCERSGDVTVERIQPNEAAIAAELFEMLAVFLRVAAEDIEACKVDAWLARGSLDRQRRGVNPSFADPAFNPV